MRRILCVLMLLLAGLPLLSAQAAEQSTTQPATREEVLKFMEVLQLRATLVRYFDGVGQQAKLGAEQGFKQKVPDPTPEQMAALDKFAEGLFKDMPVDEMLDAMVPIYQKHLTKSDLDAILTFYNSPAGQKLLREQPAMMQEGMQVGGEIGRKRIGLMMQKMDEFVAELVKQEQQKSQEKK